MTAPLAGALDRAINVADSKATAIHAPLARRVTHKAEVAQRKYVIKIGPECGVDKAASTQVCVTDQKSGWASHHTLYGILFSYSVIFSMPA